MSLPTGWASDSNYGKQHTTQRPGKSHGQGAGAPMAGAKDRGGKSHDSDIHQAEGNSGMNEGMAVKDAKHNPAPHKAAHAQRTRVISGNGNTMGEGTVTKQATGHAAYHSADPTARKKAFDFNKRSEDGKADPSAY